LSGRLVVSIGVGAPNSSGDGNMSHEGMLTPADLAGGESGQVEDRPISR
jgi:hypothetical protein